MNKDVFQIIKRSFFPRWDKGEKWIFEELDDLNGADGCCLRGEKKIQVCSSGESGVHLELILVHEICHAVTGGYHGSPWLKRMEKAALRAEKLEKQDLAAAIYSEIEEYRARCPVCTAPLFYQIIRDVAFLNFPGPTEQEILSAAGRSIGLSHNEVVANYPRARKVFNAAQREAEICMGISEMMETTLKAQAS